MCDIPRADFHWSTNGQRPYAQICYSEFRPNRTFLSQNALSTTPIFTELSIAQQIFVWTTYIVTERVWSHYMFTEQIFVDISWIQCYHNRTKTYIILDIISFGLLSKLQLPLYRNLWYSQLLDGIKWRSSPPNSTQLFKKCSSCCSNIISIVW